MGLLTFYRPGRKLLQVGIALALCSLTVLARADEAQSPQAGLAPYSGPIAKLRVTGNMENFSVDADHADAQSVLKAIFDQANAQFTTDRTVVGQVTLRLSDQSLPTTLNAVCKQLLIRYQVNAKGIYVFEQDAEAVKATILRLQDQNALMRTQLRSLGLKLPDESLMENVQSSAPGVNGPAGAAGANGPAGTFGAGGNATRGFGGGGGVVGGGRAAGTNSDANLNVGARRGGAPGPAPDSKSGALNRAAVSKPADGAAKDDAPLKYLTTQDIAEIFSLNPQTNTLRNPEGYLAFLKQNGFVYINTGGQRAPVAEVLEELGRQSNTQILIDPSIPKGPTFALRGYITPRSLPEAMNVMAQSAHLNWSWLGTSIYVSALPDFHLFLNSTTPRVLFGTSAYLLQQSLGQGQSSQFNNNANYGQPSQPPLPVTNGNGEKKTP